MREGQGLRKPGPGAAVHPDRARAGRGRASALGFLGHGRTCCDPGRRPRAARVYLHAREQRDRQLATTLDKMARRELIRSSGTRSDGQSGTQRARGRPKGSQRGPSDHGL
jgi:hypothetical protein